MNTDSEPFTPTAGKLPDGSGFFTSEVLSSDESMALPPEKRPLNYRISSKLYHAVFESIGAASMAWNPRPGDQVFNANEASKIAVDLCLKFADELDLFRSTQPPLPVGIPPRMTLDGLAHQESIAALWTDKRTRREGDGDYVLHGYTPFYDREFDKWRDEPIRLLEIGLNVGASIKLWLEYFTKAKIVGFDIADFQFGMPIDEGLLHRFSFVKGNQFSPYDLQRFVEDQPMFDIIIDDGSHASGPIIMSFQYLWSKVNPGGYYCIEDFRESVNNPESHSAGFPDQVQFAESLLGRIILGERDVEEAYVSKELLILKKK